MKLFVNWLLNHWESYEFFMTALKNYRLYIGFFLALEN